MPRTTSAKKQMRQSRTHADRNRAQRSRLRTAIKRVRSATTDREAEAAFAEAVRLLDRAGKKNLVHRNAAARTKARLAKAVAAKNKKA